MPLAAPVTKHRFPAKYRPAAFAMVVTIPAVRPYASRPPQSAFSHNCSSTRTRRSRSSIAADKNRVAGQHQSGGPARVRTSVGMSSLIGCAVPAFISASTMATIWLQHHLELLFENVADLGVGVAGGVAGRHHRVVVRIDRGRTAHHPLGELLR